MTFYAHTRDDPRTNATLPQEQWQPLSEHLSSVSITAGAFASEFGAGRLAEIAGLLHDAGKYSQEFQSRLIGKKVRVDHSTAGAQIVMANYPLQIANLLAYAIAGHHSGLPDGTFGSQGNLPERLDNELLPDCTAYAKDVSLPGLAAAEMANVPKPLCREMNAFSMAFLVRMIFSCLVDADFLDTEAFMNETRYKTRDSGPSLKTLDVAVNRLILSLRKKAAESTSPIQSERSRILERVLTQFNTTPGFFSLTVPTGGGKTYASLIFAIKHALSFGLKRIIYVIPYTSIIEQNAKVIRDVVGDAAVLEHHSQFEYPPDGFDTWSDSEKRNRLASENWDRSIIVTTAVQFFESLFASRTSRCRKLHNLNNSVIILDEAQMMPRDYLSPCLWALTELVANYGTSVVFCTATQPTIQQLMPDKGERFPFREIMCTPRILAPAFRRTKVKIHGPMTDDEIADETSHLNQVLIIVNTRRHARMLYDKMTEHASDGMYHLSAKMCPTHRSAVLSEIRQRLSAEPPLPCRVVATSLVECGVDLDFPVVFRAIAGLDSIIQAAGRCNREGKLGHEGRFHVFEPEPHGAPKAFEHSAGITRSIIRRLDEYENDLFSSTAVDAYFKELLHPPEKLDAINVLKSTRDAYDGVALRKGAYWFSMPFASIAKGFHLIDSETIPVFIPFDETAYGILKKMKQASNPAVMARAMQPYTVQVYQFELTAMKKEGLVRAIDDFIWILDTPSFYTTQYGLKDVREVKQPDNTVYIL